jgi:hypothetical protein
MKKIILAVVILLLPPDLAFSNQLRDVTRRQIYHSLLQPRYSDSSCVVNDSVRLQLPDLEINLLHGQLVYLFDSTNALTGLLFDGKARVRFSPRHEVERQQLHRFTLDSVLTCDVSHILWRFVQIPFDEWPTDGPILNAPGDGVLSSALPPTQLQRLPTKINDAASALASYVQKEWLQRRGFNLASHLLSGKYNDRTDQFVVCAFTPDEPRPAFPPLYLYLYDSRAHESIQFLQYNEKALKRPFYLICSYPLGEYFATPAIDSLRLMKYNGWVEIQPNGWLTADMGVDIFIARRNLATLFFQLSPDLIVSRITAERGDTLDFVQEKNENGLTVFLPKEITQADTLRLLFHYAGKFLEKNANNVHFLKDAVFWVPHLGYLRRAAYKIIFKSPRSLRVMAVGELLREWEEGDFRLSYYSEAVPAKAASFCLGKFDSDALSIDGLPRLEIHSSSLRNPQQRRHVAGDIANSLFLFNRLIAPYTAPVLRIVEAPGFASHGYPGLVTLSWLGFQTHWTGILQALRSHEVAHQWFGNAVGWATYHDQWLSEGFAEYLGALYVEWVIQDRKNFENLIQSWHDDLLEGGHVGVSLGLQRFGLGNAALRKSEGLAAGPLWLGFRLGQKDELDYYLSTYRKGAYIVHSLRWLLRDLNSGSDARFWAFLADFVQPYLGADPATHDLQKIAEKHFGAPLDWFFKQWIYGTAIPRYRWAYQVIPTDSGNAVQISIQQEEVPPDFRMPVPVMVEYNDGVQVWQRIWVDRNGGQFTFSPRPALVRKVKFNEGQAVLCRIK